MIRQLTVTAPHGSRRLGFHGWFIALLAATLLLAYGGSFHVPIPANGTERAHAQAIVIDQAEVVYSGKAIIRPSEAAALATEPAKLPHSWDDTRADYEGQAWYNMRFEWAHGQRPFNAVFVPRAIMNAEVYINGKWAGGHGNMQGELARRWNEPLIFQFDPSLVKPGENLLQVQVAGYRNYRSGLTRVWVGPSDVLYPIWEISHAWQITGSMLATMVAFATGLLILAYSRYMQPGQGWAYLGVAVIVFSIRHTGYFMDWAPLPHNQWVQAVHSMHAWFACLYAQFLIRYMGYHWPTIRMALWIYPSFVTLFTVLGGSHMVLNFTLLLLIPVLPMVFVVNMMLLAYAWRNRDSSATILGVSSLLFVLLSLRDLSIMVDWIPNESVLMSQYTGILVFLTGCWIVLRQFRRITLRLQKSNELLQTELNKRTDQLTEQFDLLRQAEQARAKEDERRRIMQDIHDGVGSGLVAGLNQLEMRDLSQAEMKLILQECLDDLRMAIDSLDPESDDLLALLGNFRWRFERRLKASGIQLRWAVSELPSLQGYNSRDLFDILRVVQEVFGNILKHAQAKHIELSTQFDAVGNVINLNILDDGVGMPANLLGRGRGLAHMRIRAKQLNLDFYTGLGLNGQGTGVYITLPVQRKHTPAL